MKSSSIYINGNIKIGTVSVLIKKKKKNVFQIIFPLPFIRRKRIQNLFSSKILLELRRFKFT